MHGFIQEDINMEDKMDIKSKVKPYPFYGKDIDVYGKVINTDFENANKENNIINITLINDKMLEYDELIFSTEFMGAGKSQDYKPYFYEFIGNINDIRQLNKKNINDDEWLCIELYTFLPNDYKQGIVLEGEIIFSASPIERRNIWLVITDRTAPPQLSNKIKKVYGISKDIYTNNAIDRKGINDTINHCIPKDIKKLKSIVYNVGQGNNSYLSINRNYGIFFDIGYTLSPSSTYTIKMKAAINKYSMKRPRIIILSHWDLDHIIGLVHANASIYSSVWIAPNIEELPSSQKSLSACRVCKYLNWRKTKLILLDHTFNDKIVFETPEKEIRILKGKGGSGYTKNNNNFGLLMEVKGHTSMLFTGDVEYSKMPTYVVGNTYTNIIAPHHAGNVGIPNIYAFEAIIAVGQNTYGHPSLNHLRYWNRARSRIVFTCQFSSTEITLLR